MKTIVMFLLAVLIIVFFFFVKTAAANLEFGSNLKVIMEEFKFEFPELLPDGTNLDRLAHAVSVAESSGCLRARHNNCHGIMTWKDGYRRLKRYRTTEDSYEDFKSLWRRKYKAYPDLTLAIRYSGNDKPYTWLSHVNATYNST